MEAFVDPMKKKSTIFIKLLEQGGLIEVKDPENYLPMMDYHMQRVLLRMGCVEITDESLTRALKEKRILTSDTEIRSKCCDAIKIISGCQCLRPF